LFLAHIFQWGTTCSINDLLVRLQLIPYRSQELFALFDVSVGLHAFGRDAVDHAEDPSSLFGPRGEDFRKTIEGVLREAVASAS